MKKVLIITSLLIISIYAFATVNINVWFSWEGQKEFETLVNKFNESQSLYHVNLVYIPNMTQKLQISLSAGTQLPDIALVRNDVIGMLANAKVITPISTVSTLPAFMDAFKLNGKLYAYPYYADLQVVYLNRSIYQKSLPYDWTLNDFEEVASSIKETGHVGLSMNAFSSYFFNSFYAAFNGGKIPMENGVPIVNNDGTKKAFEFYKDIFNVKKIAVSYDKSALIQSFKSGKAGMLIQGSFLIPDFLSSKLDFTILPYPTLDGKMIPPTFDAKGFVIFTDNKAVRSFLDYISRPDNEVYFCKSTYKLPASIDALHELENSNDFFKVMDLSARNALIVPTTTIFNDAYSNAITTALQLYLTKQMSLDESLQKAQEYINSQAK
ncbi:sugar ABC transporter substrate-binding protein [Athalassotoga saccharophila]|uniref:sugar ABC transporter substrate-binding protein n=1 Tax=Athalassotoga saccharophila TaxID=1441386 RepID=UPI00137B2A4D|nr:extracellular solute-binding protein [Athalassotoga saccharophila]